MTYTQKEYYSKMLKKGRLLPFFNENGLVAILTFYIGDDDAKYIRDNPWSVLDDEPNSGYTCYIDQCVSNKDVEIPFRIWNIFKHIIIREFPQVRVIKWHRFKDDKLNIVAYKLKERERCLIQ